MQVVVVYWSLYTGLCLNYFTNAYSTKKNSSPGEWVKKKSYCETDRRPVPYNPTISMCCNGKLNNRTNDNTLYCCGQSLYSPAFGNCCDGRVHTISPTNAKPRCCNGTSYDADKYICCGEAGLKKRRFRNTGCCRNKTIDLTRQICCQGNVQPSTEGKTSCCGRNSYNPYKDTCCDRTINHNIVTKSCCSRRAYDSKLSTCCNDHLTDRAGLQCCDNKAYDQNTHVCCGTEIKRKNSTNTGCCCEQSVCVLYNTDKQTCCGGKLIAKDSHLGCCGTDIYDVTMQVCCGNITLGSTPSNWRCCGNVPYDDNKQVCCGDQMHTRRSQHMRCCGTKAYDLNTLRCEDYLYSHVIPIKGKYCGTVIYKSDKELCCETSVVPKIYGQRTGCCNQTVFDTNRHICCRGIINQIPSGIPQCCGTSAYNVLKQQCDILSGEVTSRTNRFLRYCGAKMVEYDSRTHRCCGGTLYGPGNVCCQGKVARLPGIRLGRGRCCGKHAYDNHRSICCHGNLSSKYKGNKCCGTKAYNSSTHACCQGNIYPEGFTCCKGVVHPTAGVKLGQGKCCGGIGYNRKRQVCCGRRVFPKTTRKMRCCGSRPYDPSRKIFICCHATLSLISDHGRKVCCGKESYNPMVETCCKGRVHVKQNATCCGRNTYDPVTAVCCSKTVYPIAKYGKDCCQKMAYNASTQVCQPSGTIIPKIPCGKNTYDNRTQLCCAGRVHPKTAYIKCCNRRSYHSLKWMCCGGKVHAKTKICCANKTYKAKAFQCCGGIPLKNNNQYLKCCAGKVYKVAQYRCKGEKIVVKGQLRKKLCMEGTFAFLGKLKSVGRVHHSFEMLIVIRGEQDFGVKRTLKVSRRPNKQTGKNYLVVGSLAWKADSLMMEKVFLYRPWSKKLRKRLQAIVKDCHLTGAAHLAIITRLKTFGRMQAIG